MSERVYVQGEIFEPVCDTCGTHETFGSVCATPFCMGTMTPATAVNPWPQIDAAIAEYLRPRGKRSPHQDVLLNLPTDHASRNEIPIVTGLLDYFPAACAAVAQLSLKATQQHHPGEPMHWDRPVSKDHADKIGRHILERGTLDSDGVRHSAKVAWRALALLQEEIERDAGFVPAGEG